MILERNFVGNYGAIHKGEYHEYAMYEVAPETFRAVFATTKPFLQRPETVDLHDSYESCKCFLSSSGLQGFAIEPDGNVISVFNGSEKKKAFVGAVKDLILKNGGIKLDCYGDDLKNYYAVKLGAKTASVMDYDMAYDHDNIAAKYHEPDVFFMVLTNKPVEKREFRQSNYQGGYPEFHAKAYNDAVSYQNEVVASVRQNLSQDSPKKKL